MLFYIADPDLRQVPAFPRRCPLFVQAVLERIDCALKKLPVVKRFDSWERADVAVVVVGNVKVTKPRPSVGGSQLLCVTCDTHVNFTCVNKIEAMYGRS